MVAPFTRPPHVPVWTAVQLDSVGTAVVKRRSSPAPAPAVPAVTAGTAKPPLGASRGHGGELPAPAHRGPHVAPDVQTCHGGARTATFLGSEVRPDTPEELPAL